MKHQQKYILSDQSNPTQMSLNLSKSQQKLFCKSIHEQIKERTQSKETTHRSMQNNQLSQRVKQQSSLSSVIQNFFASSGQKKSKIEVSENIDKSKNVVIKDLKILLEQKDEEINQLHKQLEAIECQNCEKYKQRILKITQAFNIIQSQLLFDSDPINNNLIDIQSQAVDEFKQELQRISLHFDDLNNKNNRIVGQYLEEKKELQSKVVQLEQQIIQLQNNEQCLKKQIEALQNPYQKYKNQLQQSASLAKINSDIECQVNLDKILNAGQPYLRSRYVSQKENRNQIGLF